MKMFPYQMERLKDGLEETGSIFINLSALLLTMTLVLLQSGKIIAKK